MRITWAPLALMAELRRTTTGEDPARRFGVFRNMGPTYLYKVLPDGSTARDDDNEFPHLDGPRQRRPRLRGPPLQGPVRGLDPEGERLAARASGRFRCSSSSGATPRSSPRDPAATTEAELPRARLFPGVGHLVMRSGWGKDATWIEFTCGPYFAKHDHLDTNHFVIYHKGYLAIDAGADYTDTESPHYLNQYRRTDRPQHDAGLPAGGALLLGREPLAGGERRRPAHGLVALLELGAEPRGLAAHPRPLGPRAHAWPTTREPGRYVYARGDGTRAYQPSKVGGFVRDLLWLPTSDVLFVLDRVTSRDAAYKKAWLLHGVSEPTVVDASGVAPQAVGQGGTAPSRRAAP